MPYRHKALTSTAVADVGRGGDDRKCIIKFSLHPTRHDFDQHTRESTVELFSDWADRGERFLLAMDVTKFLMEGMAVGQMVTNREERVQRLLNYLGDRLEEIFKEGSSGAIGRHSRKS